MYYDNKKLALNLFYIVLGITLVVLSVLEILDSSIYSGMGGALTAVGAVRIFMIRKYRTDPAYREKIDVEIKDERSSFLRMKSWAWTGYFVILLESAGILIALVLGQYTVCRVLAYSVCLIMFLYWIINLILRRKY